MAEGAARLSLAVALLVLGLKALAYLLTGSVALLSDALESLVNVAAALAALLALRVARKPPDQNHPFGHTKAEYVSAVLEGVLVVLAALWIAKEALPRLLHPVPLEGLGLGLGVSLLASLLNGLLAYHLLKEGRRHRSPALTADGYHVLSDVLTSLGVVLGVGLAGLTGLWVLDPLLALAVAGQILFLGYRIVRESVGGLMDEGLPPEEVERIHTFLQERIRGRAPRGPRPQDPKGRPQELPGVPPRGAGGHPRGGGPPPLRRAGKGPGPGLSRPSGHHPRGARGRAEADKPLTLFSCPAKKRKLWGKGGPHAQEARLAQGNL